MSDRHLGAVLVTEKNGHLVGIFTGRDAVSRVLAAGKSAARTKLGDVMTANPIAMAPDKTVIEALRLMWDGGFRHVPIVDGDTLIGIVSRGDFKGLEQTRLEDERHLWERL